MPEITIETLAMAFYNRVTVAVEEYGGNTDRVYTYIRGMCDLIDEIAKFMTEEEET